MFRLVRASARDITICVIDSSNAKAKIGRDPKTCKVQLGTKAVAVSREHADLQWNSGGVTLVDTSSFGTVVDGVKIVKCSKLLKGGERLKIGQEEFILEKIEEVGKETQRIQPLQSKPTAKTSIASYFTKKSNVIREESQLADVSIRKILATETPSESQESQKEPSQIIRKPIRGRGKRVNPLFDFDDEDEATMDIAKGRILATETPSDSVPSPIATVPIAPPPARPPQPNTVTQPIGTAEKRRKVSLFSKPSQRQKTNVVSKHVEDDDIIEIEMEVSPSNEGATSQLDDGFARPSVPPTRSRTTTPNHSIPGPSSRGRIVNRRDIDSMNFSDDHMGVNASSIPTQVIPPIRKPILSSGIDGGFPSEPPRKKTKSLFEDYKKQQKKKENNKPKEKSLLDEDGIGELNIRYDYVAPKQVIGERAYSSMENLRAMEQMGKEAEARLNKKLGLDRMDEGETQMPSVEELTSILCSSHTEDKIEEEKEKNEGEVERVGNETLDDEIKSQLVTFCDNLVVSQPSFDSIASNNPSQGKGFKKFKKAKQGKFSSQSAAYSGIIGGSDLVDFRQIQI